MKYFFGLTILFVSFNIFGQASTFINRNHSYYENLSLGIDSGHNSIILKSNPNGQLYLSKFDESGLFLKKSETFRAVLPKFNRLGFMDNDDPVVILDQNYSSTPVIYHFNDNLVLTDSIGLPQLEGLTLLQIATYENVIAFLGYDQNNEYFLGLKTDSDTLDWIINLQGSYSALKKHDISFTPSGNVFSVHSGNLMVLHSQSGTEIWSGDHKYGSLSSASDYIFYYYQTGKLFKVSFTNGVVWEKILENSETRHIARLNDDYLFVRKGNSEQSQYVIYNSEGEEYRTETLEGIPGNGPAFADGNSIHTFTYGTHMKFDKDDEFKGLFSLIVFHSVNPGAVVRVYPHVFNVNKINLLYSSDLQNWELITSAASPDPNGIDWIAPETPGEYYLKIEDSDNPQNAGISDLPLTVNYYPLREYINANHVNMWVGANGMGSHDPRSDDSGLFWDDQGDESLTSVFADGPVFGFVRDDSARVYASTYRYGFTPGIINEDGSYTQSGDSSFFIYKAAKDWESLPENEDKIKFEFAQNNWPVEHGAPFIDNNLNGVYEGDIDEPDVKGDQMMWWTNHTAEPEVSSHTYGSSGDKIEVHTSVWGSTQPFPDVVYKRYKFINKGNQTLEDFYFGYWSDPDVGNAADDYAGFDGVLDLVYCYNGDEVDDGFYSDKPASVGYILLDGPIVAGEEGDTARYDGELRNGSKNLPATASHFYLGGSSLYPDPDLGVYEGTLQFYNNLAGKLWDGNAVVNPVTEDTTQFVLDGDPVNAHGWYEGIGWPGGPSPGDRRILVSAGPFTMEPGDTNVAILAIVNARASGRLNSLEKMKQLARQVRNEWIYGIITDVNEEHNTLPDRFILSQNYPNPFNPSTVIEFSLPEQSNVKLEVFNILGEKVADLVDTQMKAAIHKVNFDGSQLSSGVYVYRLKAGEINLVRKMMLLK